MLVHKVISFLFVGVCLSANPLFGQPLSIEKIVQRNPLTKEAYIFPKVINRAAPATAARINDVLRKDVLDAGAGTADNKLFENVWAKKEQSPTVTGLGYRVGRNDQSLLSLTITGEGCGAYCEKFESHYTFNARTGNKLLLDSFFTKQGLTVLADSINASRQAKLKAKIAQAKAKLRMKAVQKNRNLRETYTEMRQLYESCLENKLTADYLSSLAFLADAKSLRIFSDRCSAHYNQAVDELGTFEYVLNLNAWKAHLTNFGSAMAKSNQ